MKFQLGPEDRGQRLDVYIAAHLEDVTRSHVQALNKAGAIRINGCQEKDGYRIRSTETIEMDLGLPRNSMIDGLEARPMSLVVHYEDDQLAVIEKPAGLVVHPGAA